MKISLTKRLQQMSGKRTFHSINQILWWNFTMFAVVVLLVVSVFEMVQIRKSLKEQHATELTSVISETYSFFRQGIFHSSDEINRYVYQVSTQRGTLIRILDEAGNVLYPSIYDTSDENYLSLLTEAMANFKYFEAFSTRGTILSSKSEIAYVGVLGETITGEELYLYVSSSLNRLNEAMQGIQVQTVFLAILAVLAAFLLSGMIAMQLSKPFTEMTEKAKELAKGNFDIDFEGEYYSEIDILAKGLNHMRDSLSRSDRMQKEIIANVSHDMKTPLTMIKAYASMIQEISGDSPEKRKKHTQVIIDEADRLTMLVNEILNLSKIQAGIDTLNYSVFNLSDYTLGVMRKFSYLQETQGYRMEADIEPDLFVNADRDKIGQVIYNLIGNAVNYTGDDKVVIVSLKLTDGVVRFSVTDTGKGIAPEEIDTIWDRYYRSTETHKRPIQGTGLGLSIVKTICEKHNVPVGVKSEEGRGSVFYVDFVPADPDEVA